MSRVSFDDPGRQQRLDDAAERAAERSGTHEDKSIAGSGATLTVLGVGLGSFLFASGMALVLLGFGVVGGVLTLGGGAVAVAGVLAGRRSRGSGSLIAPPSPQHERRLTIAWETAVEAVNSSPGVEEAHKVEITAALRAALDETLAAEAERPGLMAALHNIPEGPSGASDPLQNALAKLDQRAQEFVDQCARLQASVAALAIGSDKGRALLDLEEAAGDLTRHAAAERELADALGGRPAKQTERG
jgi:hypothetical protein